jgi:DNA-binding GntR family transcriptional regulator
MALAVTSRVEAAYRDIRQRIVRGTYPPGTPLSDSELARVCGISRTPVREALCRLLEEGYVERVPGRGFYVTQITMKLVQDTFEVRRLLEAQAAACAADRHDAATLKRLRQLAPIPAGMGPEAREAAQEANAQFHLAVAQAAGNAVLFGLVRNCLDQVNRFMALGVPLQTVQTRGTAEHVAIVEAIEKRDRAAATLAMERHLDDCRQEYLRALLRGEPQDIAV